MGNKVSYSMETPKQRVLKAVSHIQPDVTPVNISNIYGSIGELARWFDYFGIESTTELREKLDLDVEYARPVYTGKNAQKNLSIWGTPVQGVFGPDGIGYASSRGGYPLAKAETVADVEKFDWPNPDDFNYQVIAEVLADIPDDRAKRLDCKYGIFQEGKSVRACADSGPWIPLICTLFDLFGLETSLINFSLRPTVMHAAIKKIEELVLEFAHRSLEASAGGADFYYYGDDFATQNGLMISPEHWREFLKPTFKKWFELAKSFDVKVWFHSCGTFRPVLPDLIDIGMDIWETVQVHLDGNDPEQLKREYGKDITFFGAICTQKTLPFGTVSDVRKQVRERIKVLGEGGGYICGSDHGIMPDVPIENVLAMIDEARNFEF